MTATSRTDSSVPLVRIEWPSEGSGFMEDKEPGVVIHSVDFRAFQSQGRNLLRIGYKAQISELVHQFVSIVAGVAAAAIAAFAYRLGLQSLTRNQKMAYGLGTGLMGVLSWYCAKEAKHFGERAKRAFNEINIIFAKDLPTFNVDKKNLTLVEVKKT